MVVLYNLFLFLYTAAIKLLAIFTPKARKWATGRINLLSRIQRTMDQEQAQRIWMHCASLGEFEQGRPVLEALRKTYPGYKIVLTFFSPSGYEIRKDYEGADYIFYLPMDGPVHARRFINAVQPELVLFVKYEFWHYYLQEVKRRKIPALLLSAVFRKNQAFFKWYGGFFRRILHCFTHILVQDKTSLALLAGIGLKGYAASHTQGHEAYDDQDSTAGIGGVSKAPRVMLGGDTRYDRVGQIAAAARPLPEIEAFRGEGHLLIGGSTWPCDENILKQLLALLPQDWKMIIAPHEIDAKHIRAIQALFKDDVLLFSEWNNNTMPGKRVLIIDNIGMLSSLYRYGDIVHIGGGFKRSGIHNVLEPAVFGLPVMIGPVYEKFAEAVAMVEAGYVFSIEDDRTARERLTILLREEWRIAIRQGLMRFMEEHKGATGRVVELIRHQQYLK